MLQIFPLELINNISMLHHFIQPGQNEKLILAVGTDVNALHRVWFPSWNNYFVRIHWTKHLFWCFQLNFNETFNKIYGNQWLTHFQTGKILSWLSIFCSPIFTGLYSSKSWNWKRRVIQQMSLSWWNTENNGAFRNKNILFLAKFEDLGGNGLFPY